MKFSFNTRNTEQPRVALMFLRLVFWRRMFRIFARRPATLTEVLLSPPQPKKEIPHISDAQFPKKEIPHISDAQFPKI